MSENQNINDVVDKTDSLEAIASFKCMKNFLFLVVIICLLVLQGAFWLNLTGYIEKADAAKPEPSVKVETEIKPDLAPVPEVKTDNVVKPAEAETPDAIEEQAGKAVTELEKAVVGDKEEPAAEETPVVTEEPKAADKPQKTEAEPVVAEKKDMPLQDFSPKKAHVSVAVRISNFVLVLAATLYTLVLLMSIKISLAGRLGGISHISRAFFLSLFALVILLPWQKMFPGVVVGAMFTPAELFSTPVIGEDTPILCKIMYFARFTAMWGIVTLLILIAQLRSARWSKTILKRLGLLR